MRVAEQAHIFLCQSGVTALECLTVKILSTGRLAEETENNSQAGNRAAGQLTLPTGDLLPSIVVQYCHNSAMLWSKDLRDVHDDLESQYLAAKGDQLSFSLDVPGKGNVEGTLWCDSWYQMLSSIMYVAQGR